MKRKERKPKSKQYDKFRYLTLLSPPGGSNTKHVCRCVCGNLVATPLNSLRTGHTKSCGCMKQTMINEKAGNHCMSYSFEYSVWSNMKSRCLGTHTNSKDYSKRGIKVCHRWVNSFQNFIDDMGESPSKKTLYR